MSRRSVYQRICHQKASMWMSLNEVRNERGWYRPTRLLPHAKMLLVSISFSPLLGRLCSRRFYISLSKCDFSRLFHTERSWRTYRFTVVFVSGRQDLPSDARAFSLTSLKRKAFCSRWIRVPPNFLQSAFWIWITKQFYLVCECNVFLQSYVRGGGGGGARVFSGPRGRPFLVSVNRDVLKNCSVNRDWSAIRETWTGRILDCFHVH